MQFIARTQKILDGWMPETKTHPACTIHKNGMWLPQSLDWNGHKRKNISPKMVNPSDTAGEREEEKKNWNWHRHNTGICYKLANTHKNCWCVITVTVATKTHCTWKVTSSLKKKGKQVLHMLHIFYTYSPEDSRVHTSNIFIPMITVYTPKITSIFFPSQTSSAPTQSPQHQSTVLDKSLWSLTVLGKGRSWWSLVVPGKPFALFHGSQYPLAIRTPLKDLRSL